jgi:hypothetical protein
MVNLMVLAVEPLTPDAANKQGEVDQQVDHYRHS